MNFYGGGKIILAPMVRVGSLPMRLLALEYGADLVFSPETVDKKIIGSVRKVDEARGTIDYIRDEKTLVIRFHKKEKERLVLQLGTADPELALQAALIVKDDVAAFDLNCGCPKRFSTQAGMGAALLQKPELLTSILRRLVQGIPDRPISAKIRVLPDPQATISLVQQILETGISALTVHCRTAAMRPRDPAQWSVLPPIIELCKAKGIPLIANGDVFGPDEIRSLLNGSSVAGPGISSVMLARAAQWNPSVFHTTKTGESVKDLFEVTRRYLDYAVETDNMFGNTKYTLMQLWIGRENGPKSVVQPLQITKTYQDLFELFKHTPSAVSSASLSCSLEEYVENA